MTAFPSALRWACRRGMLELDVLLGNFLEEAYAHLTIEEQNLFVELLKENDQNLFLWLTGREICQEDQFVTLIQKIRDHAKHRHST